MENDPDGAHEPATPPPSLREQQRTLTRQRILTALAELIETHHPLEITMAAVAERAGVSEPTLYRHYPNKRTLFSALGSDLYRKTTTGITLTSLDELIEFLPALYQQLAHMEATTRWNLAAPQDEVVRPNAEERMAILQSAASDLLADLDPAESEALMRALLLLTSPIPMIYWQDYLGSTVEEAAQTTAWIIQRLSKP